jgi:hypothetical protein
LTPTAPEPTGGRAWHPTTGYVKGSVAMILVIGTIFVAAFLILDPIILAALMY